MSTSRPDRRPTPPRTGGPSPTPAARRRRRWQIGVAALLGVALLAVVIVPLATSGGDDDRPSDDTLSLPSPDLAEDREWTGTLRTNRGDVGLTLDGSAAPQAVANFVSLARAGYFDDTSCHRLVTTGIFVLQCGDPTGTGMGGPGYSFGPIENAPADGLYPAGTIAMARAQSPDSMGSQFFLVYEDTRLPTDSGGYTVFGTITSGLDIVRAVADAGTQAGTETPVTPVIIEGVETQ